MEFICRLIQVLIFSELFIVVLVCSARFCQVGRNVNLPESLFNLTCATNQSRPVQSLLPSEPFQSLPASHRSHRDEGEDTSSTCFIFRHIMSEMLNSGFKKESAETVFGCDYEGICAGMELDTMDFNVEVAGRVGKLFCCNHDNCNTFHKMPRSPMENQICYKGSNNGSGAVELESCGHPDAYCLTTTHITPQGRAESYSCDNQHLCDQQDGHGAYTFCEKVSNGSGISIETCCCVQNKCNAPSDKSLILPINQASSADIEATSTRRWPGILNPATNPLSTTDKSRWVGVGLVAMVLVLVVVGGMVVVLTCRRKGGHRRADLILQYERLSCSGSSLDRSVGV